MIKGLYETHLYVENLERSLDFYTSKLGLQQCHYEERRRVAFLWIGKPKQAMLGLWEMPKSKIESRHFAFETSPEWIINDSFNFFLEKKIESFNFFKEESSEPMVFSWMPAVAIYFNDPNGHLLEFIGILDGLPNPDLGVITYKEWQQMVKCNNYCN